MGLAVRGTRRQARQVVSARERERESEESEERGRVREKKEKEKVSEREREDDRKTGRAPTSSRGVPEESA